MLLALDKIRLDGGTQPRTSIDEATVAEYADIYAAIGEFDAMPPVDVVFDGVHYWLGDGFHRVLGAQRAGRADIDADVRHGTQRDAVLFSVGANSRHGLRRTNADKRKAVRTLLEDAEWTKWSNRQIAERCGVTHTFVNTMREELAPKKAPAPEKKAKGVETVSTPPASPTGITPPPAPLATTTATAAPAPTSGPVESVSTPAAEPEADDDLPSTADLLREQEELIRQQQAQLDSLTKTDQAAELVNLHRRLDNAQREQALAAEKAAKAQQREAWTMKQLRRCGKAVGEDDPAKIAARVEAFVREHKAVKA